MCKNLPGAEKKKFLYACRQPNIRSEGLAGEALVHMCGGSHKMENFFLADVLGEQFLFK